MAKKQKCMIIGAAPIADQVIFKEFNPKEYFIICADAGYETALEFGITPDLIVGDFDSSVALPPPQYKCIRLPADKDLTDTMYAVIKGMYMGFKFFVMLGCMGGNRLDHTVANMETLKYLSDHNCTAVMADVHTKVFIIQASRLKLTDMIGATVSVYPFACSSCDVSYIGLKYPLNHETLIAGGTLMGVSNKVIDSNAEIKVHSGTALIIYLEE